jgi:3-oxoacyl-[acyl-carrier-protein] synthase III
METIPVGPGVPLGIEQARNPQVGIGGAYGTWGQPCDNAALPEAIELALGMPLAEGERLNLSELGFLRRHHVPILTTQEHIDLEVAVGARFLKAAAQASGWEPSEVDAVLIGITMPTTEDYVERIAAEAGIPESALKVSVHKACDGSVAALNLALNPEAPAILDNDRNLAMTLYGKKVLVGGIEGLSRVMKRTRDSQALQLFGNGAGVFGVIPGRTMQFLVGGSREVYDVDGVLQVRMSYPHSRQRVAGESLIEVSAPHNHSIRIAGLMHEPEENGVTVVMAEPMGMVKLFVRSGAAAVKGVYQAYRELMDQRGMPGKDIAVGIVHHANYKINQLLEKQLQKVGVSFPMPWLLSEFGNVSAASNMIAFLRKLSSLAPGDHVLFDGFGAGTYYDVLAVELGGTS